MRAWRESVDRSLAIRIGQGPDLTAHRLDAALLVVDKRTADRGGLARRPSRRSPELFRRPTPHEPCQPGRLASGRNNHEVGAIGDLSLRQTRYRASQNVRPDRRCQVTPNAGRWTPGSLA